MLMLAGWVPYVLGASTLNASPTARGGINVLLAASAGVLVAVLFTRAKYGKPEIMLAYAGLLGALVAVTAGAGAVSTIAAVIIGAVAGVIVPWATVQLDLVWKVDDPSGGVAVHVVGGAWGTLGAALFVPATSLADKLRDVAVSLLGLALVAALSLALSLAAYTLLKKTVGLRLSEDAEYDGVDLAEHDLNAYPDFQQTMIKSYHLREA
jgi:Amt family ammonium transporter